MIRTFLNSLSLLGLIVGLVMLCGSLTPSLLPRVPEVQGVLSGVTFAVGYWLGKGIAGLWRLLGFRAEAIPRIRTILGLVTGLAIALTLFTFRRNLIWQNSIRERMEMAALDTAYSWSVAGVACVVAVVLLLIGRGLIFLSVKLGAWLERVFPKPTAFILGALLTVLLVGALLDDLVVRKALHALDEVYATLDAAEDPTRPPPTSPHASGGPASSISWDTIGTRGRTFLSRGPSQSQIAAFTGRPAQEPVRVYAGYRSGETHEERAEIALQDLIALGGFDRAVLVVATPTGTGWLDPASVEPLAYLHGGDLAIVSTQYAYVPSWVSIIVDPDRSRLAAQALFSAVYDHWTELPRDSRPELYLFGLSLGSLGSETSADMITIFTDPVQGAFWAGPPFASRVWSHFTASRNPGTPYRLPEYRDGEILRFMNQDGISSPAGATWGPMRLIYLQHASDPMVFFSTRLAFQRPAWLGPDRGRDISPYFNWYPLVTFLQVGFDIPMATSPPSGYGHTYHAHEYITGWIEVSQPANWTEDDTARLRELFANPADLSD